MLPVVKKQPSRRMKLIAELTSAGIQFPVSIGIGYLIGRGLDRWLGTYPWCTAVFSVFGVAAAFVNIFRLNAELNRLEAADRKEDDHHDA